MKKQQFLIMSVVGLALYLIATGLAFGVFSVMASRSQTPADVKGTVQKGPQDHFTVDPSLPK